MSRQPNILLIMTDQQRADTIGALGNPHIQTPAQDRLVREGTSFISAYCASPVCQASRCSLLLGEYAHTTGCVSNLPMPQERTSLMEMLRGAGYQTHGVGKMHFGPDSRYLWGFESRDYSEEGGMRDGDDFCDFLKANGYEHIVDPSGMRSEFYYVPQPSQLPARLHNTQWSGDRSLEFLQRRDRSRPFFLWSSYIKPHPPFENPVPWSRLYRPVEMPFPHLPLGWEEMTTFWNRVQNRYKYRDQGFDGNLVRLIRAAYFACVSFVDYQIGRLLSYLEEQGELDNTLVIHTADHGELLGDFGSWGKRSILDAAARVPCLVRYPERFAAGQVCETPASLVDILPTCLSLAGIDTQPQHAGRDLAQLAAGDCDREGVICQFQQGDRGLYGYITSGFKYVYSVADDREWLFPRVAGEPEMRDLCGNPAYMKVLAQHREALIARFRADGYELPLDGDGWRKHPRLEVPSTPDAWQLYQDGGRIDDLFPPGYRPQVDPFGGLPVRGI
jgi:arylsulfatase A-like enzyme